MVLNERLPNKRLKLPALSFYKEAVVSCPGGHGLSSNSSLRRRAVRPQPKPDPLGSYDQDAVAPPFPPPSFACRPCHRSGRQSLSRGQVLARIGKASGRFPASLLQLSRR